MSLLERAVKRYTSLAPLVLPPLLAALAKLPPGAVSGQGRLSSREGGAGEHARCWLLVVGKRSAAADAPAVASTRPIPQPAPLAFSLI